MRIHPYVVLATVSALTACSEPDFPDYNALASLRVLAVRAEPADVQPSEQTTLDALIYVPRETASLAWSLCPWPSDPNDGYACPLDEATWRAALAAVDLAEAPNLDLGVAQTASFRVPDDRDALSALCFELLARLGSSATLPPRCEEEWAWTVRLHVTDGDDVVDAVKVVPVLLSEGAQRNQNPVVQGLSIEEGDSRRALEGAPLAPDTSYTLRVNIDESQAERYQPAPAAGQSSARVMPRDEALIFTWFVTSGDAERMRSTFREGVESLERASRNVMRTATQPVDMQLFVVVRDNRGGVDFIEGTVPVSP